MDDLIKEYCDYAVSIMDEDGIYPTPGISKDQDGKLSIYAMATDAHGIISTMLSNGNKQDIQEQIFSLDTYTKEGQGTTLDSCLVMFHVIRGTPARIGVLEYSWNAGQPIRKEPDWNNPFWTKQYQRIENDLTKAFSF